VLVGLAVLVVRRLGGNYLVDALASPTSKAAGEETWLIGTEILAQIGWAAILYGVIAPGGAILAGPTRAATAVRRGMAPMLSERPGLAWTAFGCIFLLLIPWDPRTHCGSRGASLCSAR